MPALIKKIQEAIGWRGARALAGSVALAALLFAAPVRAQGVTYEGNNLDRTGAQTAEGPLILTCTTCTNGLDIRAPIANTGAANGGSLAFNDPARWLSTTTALLESSTSDTAGIDTAFTFKALNALSTGVDVLFDFQRSDGTSLLKYHLGSTLLQVNGNVSAGIVYVSSVYANGTNPLPLRGSTGDGATAIAVKVASLNSLTTDGAKIASFYSDNATTERAYISNLGAIRPGTSIAAAPAQPYACAVAHEGELIYRRDTDAGTGYGGMCACACTGEATPTCAWQAVADGAACF